MFRFRLLALAGCLMAGSSVGGRAQEPDLKDVLRQAITAHGGEAALLKFKAATSKFKGTMELIGKTINVNGESSFQKPDKLKNILNLEINGMTIETMQVFNGKKFWVTGGGKTIELKDEKILNEVRESLATEGGGSLVAMLDKPYQLAPIGEVKVMDREAVGIRVSKKGQRDISMFFDKKTHLLVKMETRAYDPMSKTEVTQEKFFSAYKNQNGLQSPGRVVIHKDGKQFMEMQITETTPLEKLDDSHFDMP